MIRFEIEKGENELGRNHGRRASRAGIQDSVCSLATDSWDPRAMSGMEGTCNLARRGEGVQAEGWGFRDH